MPSLAEKRKADDEEAPIDAQARPEELRLLEALLFASTEPLDQAALAKRMPDGVDIKAALAQLQAEYATRGVNLVRIANKWTCRTAGDLAWLMTRESSETRRLPPADLWNHRSLPVAVQPGSAVRSAGVGGTEGNGAVGFAAAHRLQRAGAVGRPCATRGRGSARNRRSG